MNDQPQGRGANVIREVSVGLSVLGVLFSIFVGAAYQRFSGPTVPTPAAISSIKHSIVSKQQSKEDLPSEEPVYRTAGLPEEPTPAPRVAPSPLEVPSVLSDVSELPATTFLPNPNSLEQKDTAFSVNEGAVPPAVNSSGSQFETTPEIELPPGRGFSPTSDELEPLELPDADIPFGMEAPSEPSQVVKLIPNQDHAHELSDKLETSQSHRQDVIHPNDSFWKISLRAYGSGEYFRALYEANRTSLPNPDQLPVGAKVMVPELGKLRNRYPELCSNKTVALVSGQQPTTNPTSRSERIYVAQHGDTLFDIARFELGQAGRYVEILQLNVGTLDGRREQVPAGTRLRLPTD